ncbi:MAG: BolA family protein [Pseudomonadota bacterium]
MSATARMTEKLTTAFAPEQLDLRDDSERHRGHGGWREGGETHFHLTMVASTFAGMNRVARQRAVNRALAAEFEDRLHALTMDLKAPGE